MQRLEVSGAVRHRYIYIYIYIYIYVCVCVCVCVSLGGKGLIMHNYCTPHIIKENFESFLIHRCNYILLYQVYCVWQVVKTPTIISNNPVYRLLTMVSPHSQTTQYNEKSDLIQKDCCVARGRIRNYKLPQRCIWGLCSFGMLRGVTWLLSDVSKQPIGSIFKGQTFQDHCLTLEDGAIMLFRNICNKPPTYTV
jgi:hypothetical protein